MFVGLSFSEIKNIIENFNGVKRRFEKKGLLGDILVVDDYAHHPTEIKEALKAAKNTGYERLITVFQPHRFSRTKHLMQEFSKSFELVDELIVTDIYSAGERKLPGVNSKKLVSLIKANTEVNVNYIDDFEEIISHLKQILKPKDLLLTVGAGDVYKIGKNLLTEMREEMVRR